MTSFSPGTGSCSYWYRADGMRIQKVVDIATAVPEDDSGFWDENLAVNKPTTRYYHDGQSVFEEDFTRYEGGTALKTDVIRYALGARGIERIAWHPDGGSWGFKYPLYDLHGNMVATLHRGTGGAYTLADVKTYDAWGGVRSGSGGPTQRYCASLGHVQDDESSLIYMRARYYEPTTGRFISEDPARDGANWYSYCRNKPTAGVDIGGTSFWWFQSGLLLLYMRARTMGPGEGLLYFRAQASELIIDWMNIESTIASELEASALAMQGFAETTPSPIEKDIALQLCFADRDLAAQHRGEAKLIGALGAWMGRMYAFMLMVDLQ